MSQQTIKQKARRTVRETAERRRKERLERERRIEDLAAQVMTAIGERDEAVAKKERRAGTALRELTEVEGISLAEAVEWCDEQISVREATRLRRLVDDDATTSRKKNGGAAAGESPEADVGTAVG